MGGQMNQMNGQMQQMMPGGMNEQDQLAQQIRDTERQMQQMQEQIKMAQMNVNGQPPGQMMSNPTGMPNYGGGGGMMGGDFLDDQSDSGSENDWWNQPVSYGPGSQQGMPATNFNGMAQQ